jgi:F0F1-type ATP synthase assembly protein I
MVELYFLLYRLPKIMTKLARERKRSAVGWSLMAIGAWIGAEIVVGILVGVCYEIGRLTFDWPKELPAGLTLVLYIVSLVAALGAASIVRKTLESKTVDPYLPPPPPQFSQN